MHMHSNAAYADIQTLGNNAHLIRLTLHSMTDPNSNMIRKDQENYSSGVVPVSKNLSSPIYAWIRWFLSEDLRSIKSWPASINL